MSDPKITVYIASHNYGRFLEGAIESVLRQSCGGWELLVIDDASTDNTRDVMKLYEGDERVRLFHTNGIGLPAVCNFALMRAKGEYLIRLDGDDLFDENILLVLSHHLDTHPDCALVFPDFHYIDDQGTVFAHERRERIFVDNHLLDMPANGACTLIRTQVLRDLGGYREDLGAQDGYDLWTRMLGKYRPANLNLPLFYYRRHGENLTNNPRRILTARRQIQHDHAKKRLREYQPVTALIPCRKRYDFCPDVWSRKLGGKSLLEIAILKCLASPLIGQIVVASDTHDVKQVMDAFKDDRLLFFERRPEETTRSASLADTLFRLSGSFDPAGRGLTVLTYLQAPFVTTETLEEALCTLILNDADGSMGVQEISDNLFRRGPHGLVPINPRRGFTSDFDTVYREANVALAFKNKNLQSGSLGGPLTVHFTVNPEECVFLSSEQTLRIAEILAQTKT
ncbi:MAG: glycosyltransferase [Planctomycetota bacterium]